MQACAARCYIAGDGTSVAAGRAGRVVARLVGTREPSTERIWPQELASLRATLAFQGSQTFRADQLSFEAMARNYNLERVVAAN